MRKVKVYIVKNSIEGYKIVKDDKKHIDCSKPLIIFPFKDYSLDDVKSYCTNNNLEVIRVCQ